MVATRIGFIGAGGIAGRHLGVLQNFDDVKVVAFSDPVQERAAGLAEHVRGTAYRDFNEMLDKEQLDAVYICLPPFAHGEPEFAAVERKLPFFVEKPLSAGRSTAAQIDKAVRDSGLVTAVGYHWRYLTTTEQAQELLAKNPPRLALGYWLDQTPPPNWWRKQDQSGGQMVEQTTHIFDLARVLVGEVSEVYAIGSQTERSAFPDFEACDVSVASLKFESGAIGSIASTCLLNWPHRVGLHLFCEAMVIELSEFELMVDTGHGRPVTRAEGDPFVREDRDFVDAVQGKENRVRSPYSESLKTHMLTTAASHSVDEGKPVKPGAPDSE